MISARTLNKWRKEALKDSKVDDGILFTCTNRELVKRILLLTQELIDLHLIKK